MQPCCGTREVLGLPGFARFEGKARRRLTVEETGCGLTLALPSQEHIASRANRGSRRPAATGACRGRCPGRSGHEGRAWASAPELGALPPASAMRPRGRWRWGRGIGRDRAHREGDSAACRRGGRCSRRPAGTGGRRGCRRAAVRHPCGRGRQGGRYRIGRGRSGTVAAAPPRSAGSWFRWLRAMTGATLGPVAPGVAMGRSTVARDWNGRSGGGGRELSRVIAGESQGHHDSAARPGAGPCRATCRAASRGAGGSGGRRAGTRG